MESRVSLLQLLLCIVVPAALSLPAEHKVRPLSALNSTPTMERVRRSSDHIITECVTVTSEEGHYYFKGQTPHGQACGLYLVTDPDRRVQLTLDYMDVPCSQGGLVTLFDGWELNQQFFPSESDHPLPMRMRFLEFCSGVGNSATKTRMRKTKRVLLTAQNAALVQFRAPERVRGFTVSVSFPKNPTPCNILLEGTADVYTLRNYGKNVNCSLATLFPARVKVLSLSVGMANSKRDLELETGTIHKCEKRGMPDYVELGGTEGLDTQHLSVADSICGLDSKPGSTEETILCGVTAVRLVSSGEFDNAVTVDLQLAGEEDFDAATLVCGL